MIILTQRRLNEYCTETKRVEDGENASHADQSIGRYSSSLHDRIMQCFYELKGGVVRYGDEHSAYNGHAESGATFASGKFPEWDAEHPIHLADKNLRLLCSAKTKLLVTRPCGMPR